jgi:long-chain acyl-CoA synthetase
MSFTQLYQRSCSFAHALLAEGIGAGDVVAIHLPNCLEYAVAYHGILLAGAAYSPMNPLLPPADLAFQLDDSGAQVIITSTQTMETLEAARDQDVLRKVITVEDDFERFCAGHPRTSPEVRVDIHGDLAHLAYTGGTTGRSKGVTIPHRNVVVNTLQSACWISGSIPRIDDGNTIWIEQVGSEDEYPNRVGCGVTLAQSPWFHVMGTVGSLDVQLISGSTQIVHPRFDPGRFLENIEHFGVTTLSGAPPLFAALVAHPRFAEAKLDTVRYISSAAAPLPVELIAKMRAGFRQDVVINEAYGLTEVTLAAVTGPAGRSAVRKAGSVGVPIYDTEITLSADDGSRDVPVGETGEVCIKGPQVMVGYWNQPAATAATLIDGWLHTGDVGKFDEDGYLYIVDRKKDMLIYKGYNVYPRHLEELLVAQPGVSAAAVVGKPDPSVGEVPVAFIVPEDAHDLDPDRVCQAVNSQLLPYQRIRQARVVRSIPLSAAGKVLKKELREQLGQGDGDVSATLRS